jgi:hypothetical protein
VGRVRVEMVDLLLHKVVVEIVRVLLKYEYVRVDLRETSLQLLQLTLLVQETQLEQRLDLLQVVLGTSELGLLNCLGVEDVVQQGVVHQQVVQQGCAFLLLRILQIFHLPHLNLEHPLPFFLEVLSADKGVVDYAHVRRKHGRVPPRPQLEIYLAHLPGKVGRVKIGKVLGDEREEDVTDLVELSLKVCAVKLERTVHNATVVQRGHPDRALLT